MKEHNPGFGFDVIVEAKIVQRKLFFFFLIIGASLLFAIVLVNLVNLHPLCYLLSLKITGTEIVCATDFYS